MQYFIEYAVSSNISMYCKFKTDILQFNAILNCKVAILLIQFNC